MRAGGTERGAACGDDHNRFSPERSDVCISSRTAGDFWHARGALPVEPLNEVLRVLRDWTRPTLMLVGNHDQVGHHDALGNAETEEKTRRAKCSCGCFGW